MSEENRGSRTAERLSRGRAGAPPPRAKNPGREALEWIICIVIALIIAWLVHTFLGQMIIVKGTSMVPTLENGERVIVSKISYIIGEPQRGDIAVVRYPDSRDHFIKRVIAVSGDTISISDSVLYLNGEPQQEDYILEPINYNLEEQVVPEGSVFVMGDNRNRSKDSHIGSVGNLPFEQVEGKAVLVVWPFSNWRTLKNR